MKNHYFLLLLHKKRRSIMKMKQMIAATTAYSPEQPWIDQTWRPSELELVK